MASPSRSAIVTLPPFAVRRARPSGSGRIPSTRKFPPLRAATSTGLPSLLTLGREVEAVAALSSSSSRRIRATSARGMLTRPPYFSRPTRSGR
jgi:hypothetical protein